MRKFLRQLFTWKALVRLVFVVGLLATLLLIFITEENWRGRRAWAAYRSAAEARGEKLFLKDFIPPDVPDAENYAAIPLIRGLFEKPPEGKKQPDPFVLPNGNMGRLANVSEQKTTNLETWQAYFVEKKLIPETSGNVGRDILDGVKKYEPLLQELRDASARPSSKFPPPRENGIPDIRAHVALIRSGTLFGLRSEALLALDDGPAAYREISHMLRIHEAMVTEPTVIMAMLRNILLDQLGSVVRDGLAEGRWADAELRAMEKDLAGINLLDEFQSAISTDRGFCNQVLQQIADSGARERGNTVVSLFELSLSKPSGAFEKFISRILWGLYPEGWVFQNMVKASEYCDQISEPYRSGTKMNPVTFIPQRTLGQDWLKSIGANSGPKQLYYSFLGSLLVSDIVEKGCLATHTMLQQARLACAMERFRQAKGAFPAELGALVPDYLPAMPVDVCDGNPLRYRRNGDGSYDLWSIGWDRKDDGGKPLEPDPHRGSGGFMFQPDWVWHMPKGKSPE